MKFSKIDLLTLLISLFILSGCKNQDGIGLTPGQQASGTLLVDTNVIVNTVPEDSVYTQALAKTPMGYFNDPLIGTTEANMIMNIGLPGNAAYTLPVGIITVDSALLVLRYADGFYGDSLTSKYKANVYQLNEVPLGTGRYYNTRKWNVNTSTLLGTKTFVSRTHTNLKILDIVPAAKDTFKIIPPEVRIPLSTAFINNSFFNAPSEQLASNTLFRNAIKGLYVTMDKTAQIGTGGTFMVALDSSAVAIYYHTDNGSGVLDTEVVSLAVNTHAAEIKHVYNATVQAALSNTTTSNSTFYLQGPAGLRTKISFPGLADIAKKAGGTIIINRAELVVTPVAGSLIPYSALPKLSMYQLDITNQRVLLQDATPGARTYQSVDVFGGFFNAGTTNDYHFIITGYIQDLMLGRTVDYGTYIGPVDNTNTSSVDYLATPAANGRVVAVGTNTNKASANYPYRIKMNLIYTKVGN